MNNLKELFYKVSKLVDADRKIQEERRKRGEKFNVFNVLGLWSEEVRLHSAFLSELLNPNGNHGLNDKFLKAFIEIACKGFDINTEYCTITAEYYIGAVTTDGQRGGRIDILIRSGNRAIIIENKIYAGDQVKQLIRYENFAKDNNLDFQLLYLTLYGDNAADDSCVNGEYKVSYEPISYSQHIIRWLDRCIEFSSRQPLVRETIYQYQTLVKQLTHQNMESQNQKEIMQLMMDNPEESFIISENIYNLRVNLLERCCKLLSDDIGIDIGSCICEYPYISIKYKKLWIVIGGNESKALYITLRTDDQIIHKKTYKTHIYFADSVFDKSDAVTWNPFGYRYLDYSIADNSTLLSLVDNNSIIYRDLLGWVIKIKEVIDNHTQMNDYR